MSVTISLIEPRIELVFEDDTTTITSAVDADTLLGVIPGSFGLDLLATETSAEARDAIGAVAQAEVAWYANEVVAAHALALDPHQIYLKRTEVTTIADPPGTAAANVAAHALAVDPHSRYLLKADVPAYADQPGAAVAAVGAHTMAVDPHQVYQRKADISTSLEQVGSARAAVAAHAMALDPHALYLKRTDAQTVVDPIARQAVAAHESARGAHRDRPTFDQSILFSSFFGG